MKHVLVFKLYKIYTHNLEELIKDDMCKETWNSLLKPHHDVLSYMIDLLKSIVDGLVDIHSKSFIHRCLDTASIYLINQEDKLVAKICNLVYSASVDQESMITLPENEENKKWRPPEQLLVSDETQKIDLFNLGTIVHQILVANTKAQNSLLRPLASLIRSEAEACYLITKLKIRVAESR